jgi:two-component system OmpR family sensor kinase
MPVLGAEDLLTRLIDNLIGNALTHTPAGTEVRVTAAANDRAAELTVSDDGPGIDPAVLSRLFDRFVRGPGTSAGGSGLGLALVREIATWHGATVTVETQPGQGSTFTVRFPSGGAARSDNGS